MIPKEIQAIFDFIDYLDNHKVEYIDKYIPLCEELTILIDERKILKPNKNYNDKLAYDKVQQIIVEKFEPIKNEMHIPISNTLRNLGIWSGDETYSSIWNNNITPISDFKRNFDADHVSELMTYKNKYLSFRKETNSDFLGLWLVFDRLDEILKELFDFFKDTTENEFDLFETKTVEVGNIEESLEYFRTKKGENIKFSIPHETLQRNSKDKYIQRNQMNIKELIMGDKIQVGKISDNNGQVIVGKEIKNIQSSNQVTNNKEITKNIESKDRLSKKSYNWQKWGIIVTTILSIIAIAVTIAIATTTK